MKSAIYKITNLKNGKIYIGQTRNPELRWWQHKNNRGSKLVSLAIEKYGLEFFNFEILEWTDDPDSREIQLIKEFDSYRNGYNQTLGGVGGRSTEEDKVDEIYQLLTDSNLTYQEISQKVGIGLTTISFINNGKAFQKEGYSYPLRKVSDKRKKFFLSREDVAKIEAALLETQSLQKTAKNFGVDRGDTLAKINKGTHPHSSKNYTFPIVRPRKATIEEVREIESFLAANHNLSLNNIATIFNREREIIRKINSGKHVHSLKDKKYPIR